ncbi:MAG TPA: ABC transporter ATP-binding protein [bacterium]|nr:ABC transporter ATP-binding protein [bacterium]
MGAPPAPGPVPRLAALDVDIAYGEARVVEGASFAVARGEKLVIIGPSGCGKTTLLKALAGFLFPARGAILQDGHPVTGPGPDRAVVFQDFEQLFPWRTVLGNVVYALGVARGVRGAAAVARARQMLDLVNIAQAADRYPHQLSGGMKQRTAIARALALEPEVLLMDEPFGALDEITRSRLQIELNEIWKRTGVTIVLVTHSIQEAVFLGHRVLVMSGERGRVREVVDTRAADDLGSAAFKDLSDHLRTLLVEPSRSAAPLAAAGAIHGRPHG